MLHDVAGRELGVPRRQADLFMGFAAGDGEGGFGKVVGFTAGEGGLPGIWWVVSMMFVWFMCVPSVSKLAA